MRLTIGMPSFNNFTEVFFTVQALRMYHNLKDCEILVIDNFGDGELERFIKSNGSGQVRYEKCVNGSGPAFAKNKVFELAKGEMVLCIDSHILLKPGALDKIPVTDDLITGPLVYNNLKDYVCAWKPVWRGNMWGIWGDYAQTVPEKDFEIWGMGGGCFCTKKSSWLGFNPKFKGFGGEEGYLHTKYRKAGRKVICHTPLVWMHQFDRKIPYPLKMVDRVHNYLIGFAELGLDTKEMEAHFGPSLIQEAKQMISNENKPIVTTIKPQINSNKLISALCITYGRPHLLEEAVASFLRQDYPNKELIIVNDLPEQEIIFKHPQVKVFNLKNHFSTLGEKRNKSIELASGEIFTVWDDDDISLPWRLSQVAKAFNSVPNLGYFKPEKAWCYYGNELKRPDINMYYSMSSFTKKAFQEVGKYKSMGAGEDVEFFDRMIKMLGPNRVKTMSFPDHEYPFIYGWRYSSFHTSAMRDPVKIENYIRTRPIESKVQLVPNWKEDYLEKTRLLLK